MFNIIKRTSLGKFHNEWLNSKFHFNFSGTTAPMGHAFGPLRVWNDDEIAANSGFDMHPHRDMEIITYVRRGAITHQDSLGNKGRTGAGDVQVMSAGTGIVHAEFNRETEATELFQIWVEPNQLNLPPRWDAMEFPKSAAAEGLVPLASGQAEVTGGLKIFQNATLYGAHLDAGTNLSHRLVKGRKAYLVVADGHIKINGNDVMVRDGVAIMDEAEITLSAVDASDILLFDLP